MTLTKAEINYLLWLIDDNIKDGSYYGNKKQYYKRVDGIIRKLKNEYKKEATECPIKADS
jgi:hypothetical protein